MGSTCRETPDDEVWLTGGSVPPAAQRLPMGMNARVCRQILEEAFGKHLSKGPTRTKFSNPSTLGVSHWLAIRYGCYADARTLEPIPGLWEHEADCGAIPRSSGSDRLDRITLGRTTIAGCAARASATIAIVIRMITRPSEGWPLSHAYYAERRAFESAGRASNGCGPHLAGPMRSRNTSPYCQLG